MSVLLFSSFLSRFLHLAKNLWARLTGLWKEEKSEKRSSLFLVEAPMWNSYINVKNKYINAYLKGFFFSDRQQFL